MTFYFVHVNKHKRLCASTYSMPYAVCRNLSLQLKGANSTQRHLFLATLDYACIDDGSYQHYHITIAVVMVGTNDQICVCFFLFVQ